MKKYFSLLLCLFVILKMNCQIINGYTDKQSYRAGDVIKFYLSGSNPSQTSEIPLGKADGSFATINGNIVLIPGFQNMTLQTIQNVEPWKNGFGYTVTNTWVVPLGLKSGLYSLGGVNDAKIPIIIKGNISSDIVVICPTNKINAYTESGGKSLYNDFFTRDCVTNGTAWNNNCNDLLRATTVSFLRPQAFDNGNINGFFQWVINQPFDINAIADIDLDDYSEINSAKLIIIIGHSEYWTRKARLNFDKFVDNGKNALVLSGNSMWWQVRYEDQNYLADNTKLTCYKADFTPPINPACTCPPSPSQSFDTSCDPLLHTVEWAPQSGFTSTTNPSSTSNLNLKFSVIGSIGSDISHGGWGAIATDTNCLYGGFHGYKIIIPNSPILNNTNLNQGDILQTETGEFDTTLISNLDVNNNLIGTFPEINLPALGFYRAEIVAYEKTKIPNLTTFGKFNYAPILLFQKTKTSGKIINVNSNQWCSYYSMIQGNNYPSSLQNCNNTPVLPADSFRIQQITKNMISLLSNNLNSTIFTTPEPTSFAILPASRNVSYSLCLKGSLLISPNGAYVTNGFKVDNKNDVYAKIENCSSCNSSGKINNDEEKPNKLDIEIKKFIISPNPNKGVFNVTFNEILSGEIEILDLMGKTIYKNDFTNEKDIKVELQYKQTGIYVVKIIIENQVFTDRIIKE